MQSNQRNARRRRFQPLSSITSRRWKGYVAAGTATLAAGHSAWTPAEAAVVHHDPADILISSPAVGMSAYIYLDLNSDGIDDFSPAHNWRSAASGVAALFASGGNSFAGEFMNGYFYPYRMSAGLSVGTQPFVGAGARGDMVWGGGSPGSHWVPASAGADATGYLGVRFDAAAGSLFGWIRVTVGPGYINRLTIHEWAYNDAPGAAIRTGQTMSALFQADFDNDGDVDGDDFLQWQSSFGQDAGGDADTDGDTDGDDFLIWQSEFGSGNAATAPSSVPEPGCLGLLAFGGAGLFAWRKMKSGSRQRKQQ